MVSKILGKLKGLICSAKENSRNGGRHYTEKFWDGIFDSNMFHEGIENKMYFGEFYHPDYDAEYGQIHPDRSAIVLTNVEKKGLDYIGTFEILPTKAGETLKSLIDIGCRFGISSRGYSDYDNQVFDDPSTFDFITFDIVAFPGIESARLDLVDQPIMESINRKNKTQIMERLNRLSDNDKYLKTYIDKTLKNLNEVKEDFDDTVNIEEIKDYIDDEDLLEYAVIIKTNSKGEAYFEGTNGIAPISYSLGELEPNSKYLVEDLYYNNLTNTYNIIDNVIKL